MTPRALFLQLVLAGAVVAVACGDLKSAEEDPSRPDDPAARFGDAGPFPSDASSASLDGGRRDGNPSVEDPKGDAAPGSTGLDPGVSIPPLAQEECALPGGQAECPSLRPCRIATPDAGRCDDCTVKGTCSRLVGQSCTTGRDCDLLLQCFRGVCTLFCRLPEGTECGGEPDTCVDVGHGTVGLCDPAKL